MLPFLVTPAGVLADAHAGLAAAGIAAVAVDAAADLRVRVQPFGGLERLSENFVFARALERSVGFIFISVMMNCLELCRLVISRSRIFNAASPPVRTST